MSTSDLESAGSARALLSRKPLLSVLLCAWILLTALFFFLRFSSVFFLTYRDVIAALFRQFFDS